MSAKFFPKSFTAAAAIWTAFALIAASVLPAVPAYASGGGSGISTMLSGTETEKEEETDDETSQKSFSINKNPEKKKKDSLGASDAYEAHDLLERYTEKLGSLNGMTYRGYLWNYGKNFKSTFGYDTTEIPVREAATCIYDFDQDGEDELLAVGINNDYTMNFTMYEGNDGKGISASNTFNTVVSTHDVENVRFYVSDQRGSTSVFLYQKKGPVICVESTGSVLQITGRVRKIMTVKYDGTRFRENSDAFFSDSSGSLMEDYREYLRGIYESYGTGSLKDSEVQALYDGHSLKEYLPDVREIMRTDTTLTADPQDLTEWMENGWEGRYEATSIHFASQNELYESNR